MPIIHAIVLGIVQGLSEFLPISSSGHLLLVPWLFKWHDFAGQPASFEKAFDVALHLGTLVAVIGYFWKDLVVYVRDGVGAALHRDRRATTEGRLAWLFVLGSIPAAVAGALGQNFIEDKLGKPVIIAISLIVFGLLLGWADRLRGDRKVEHFDRADALRIGAAQILALNPGTSRSGITMTAGRMSGYTRDAAARISFLLAIPVTAGAIVLKMAKLAKDGIPHGFGGPMIAGVLTAGVFGWLAVWGTLRLVRTRTFLPFVVYRVALGVLVLGVAAARH
jgi:undecaprenyl-diphosphatase